MKDYKSLLEHKDTKQRKIVCLMANNLPAFKTMLKGAYPDFKVVKAEVNKDNSMMYYCNACQKEIRTAEKATHPCQS